MQKKIKLKYINPPKRCFIFSNSSVQFILLITLDRSQNLSSNHPNISLILLIIMFLNFKIPQVFLDISPSRAQKQQSFPMLLKKKRVNVNHGGDGCEKEGKKCHRHSLSLLSGLLFFLWVSDLGAH